MALAIPSSLTVQGHLSNAAGQPANGNYSLTVTLYDAANAGNSIWADTLTVTVSGGVFDVALGQDVVNPLLADYFTNNPQMWLGVTVDAGPGVGVNGDAELPRQPLTTVGYAFAAQYAAMAETVSGGVACQNCVDIAALAFDPVTEAELESALGALQIPSGSCEDGEAVVAINEDGTISCGPAGVAVLPPNGLDEISNGLLSNQFVDVATSGETPLDINTGVTTQIVFPDIGTAEDLTVTVDVVTGSDLSGMTIKLIDPELVQYTLYDKDGAGVSFAATFPTPQATQDGDLTTWVGKNPKGTWVLQIIDVNLNAAATLNSWSINLQTLSNKKIASAGDIYMQGHQIKDLGEPTEDSDAATKNYVDTTAFKAGTIITRWGTSVCPNGFEKLFDGLTYGPHHGHSGAGDLVCVIPPNQGGVTGNPNGTDSLDLLYPISVDHNNGTNVPSQKLIRCAKCYTPQRAPCWRLVGGNKCPGSFEAIYSGFMFGGHHSQSSPAHRICIDGDNFEGDQGTSGDYIYAATLQEKTGSSGFDYDTSDKSLRCAWCCRP